MRFERLSTESQVRELVLWHNEHSNSLVIDVETTSVEARSAKLLEIQISGTEDNHAVIFDTDYRKLLVELRPDITLIAHNAKYDLHVLYRHGVDLLERPFRDTLLLGHLVDENRKSYSLDSYVKEYWNDDYKEKFWKEYKTYQEAPTEAALRYACLDIVYTRRLYNELVQRLTGESIPDNLVTHVHRLQSSLLRTEIEGIRVDRDYLEALGVRIKSRLNELEPQMRSMVRDEIECIELEAWLKEIDKRKTDKGKAGVQRPSFSFESTQQLQHLLYDCLHLPKQRNEKTKATSTDFASLEKLRDSHPLIELIQENRELQKVYGTYVEGTIERLEYDPWTGCPRIYPQFRVAGTVTGRLSHNNPNLAQLPKSGGVRAIYVPDRGRVLISADYSQLEVVIEANLTGDKNLIRIIQEGISKHDVTASELGCSRDIAKTLNFGMQYHCSYFKVAKLVNCSVDEAKRIWNRYWEIYSGPKQLKDRTDKQIDAGIDLVTCFGRKRRFPKIKRPIWHADYRQGYNFLVQSPGADLTSRAFYLVAEALRESGEGRALFSVHDEIIIEVHEETVPYWEWRLKEIMTSVGDEIGLKVPLKAQSSGPMSCWED